VRPEAALHKLKKPEKPIVLRWNTLADCILFTPLYMEALQFALDEERVNAGSNAPSGSIPAMCAQWIKWSGSSKLRALLSMAVEFIVDVWRPADKLIALRDLDYDVHGCFKTFSRPMRVLNLVMQIEARLGDVNSLPSFSVVLEAFGMEQVAEVEKLYKHMYSLARASVLRNSGRYLSGVHLFGGPFVCACRVRGVCALDEQAWEAHASHGQGAALGDGSQGFSWSGVFRNCGGTSDTTWWWQLG
jgi:hypothetical protein